MAFCQSGVWKVTVVGLGVGQSWQDVTASRGNSVAYTNTTLRPIYVSVSVVNAGTISALWGNVDGVEVAMTGNQSDRRADIYMIVPSGSTYSATWNGSNSLYRWAELR